MHSKTRRTDKILIVVTFHVHYIPEYMCKNWYNNFCFEIQKLIFYEFSIISSHTTCIYIYTSISIASISFTGRMKFISRWTPLALSPRKGTENTNDVRNSPLFLECCYFKIASTRCKAILIASPYFFRTSQYRLRLLLLTSSYSVYVQFNKNVYLKVLTV